MVHNMSFHSVPLPWRLPSPLEPQQLGFQSLMFCLPVNHFVFSWIQLARKTIDIHNNCGFLQYLLELHSRTLVHGKHSWPAIHQADKTTKKESPHFSYANKDALLYKPSSVMIQGIMGAIPYRPLRSLILFQPKSPARILLTS